MLLLNLAFLFDLIKKFKFIVLKCWEFFSKWGQEHKNKIVSVINASAITSSPLGLFSTLSVGQAFMPPWLSELTLPEPPSVVVSTGFLSVVTSSTLTEPDIMSEVRLIISSLSTPSLLTSLHSVKNTDVLDILFDYVINLEHTVCKSKQTSCLYTVYLLKRFSQ